MVKSYSVRVVESVAEVWGGADPHRRTLHRLLSKGSTVTHFRQLTRLPAERI